MSLLSTTSARGARASGVAHVGKERVDGSLASEQGPAIRQARKGRTAGRALAIPLSLALAAGCAPLSAYALTAGSAEGLAPAPLAAQGTSLSAAEEGASSLYSLYLPVLFRAANGLGEFAESYQASDASQWSPEYLMFDLGADGVPELLVRTSSFSGAGLVHVFSVKSGEVVQVGSYWEWFGGSAGNSAGELFVAGWNQGSSYVNEITVEDGKIVSTFLKSGKATTSNPSGEIQVVNEFLASHRASWLESAGVFDYTLLDKQARYSLSKGVLSVAPAGEYTGQAIRPAVTVKFANSVLQPGVDYEVDYQNNVNAGVATATVTGLGDYKGTLSARFNIARADVSKATATLAAAGVYTGQAKTPAATVKLGDATLKAGTDYSVSYQNNVNAGTGSATIVGKGNYRGSKSVNFAIGKANVQSADLTVAAAGAYTGLAKMPTVKAVVGGRTLSQDSDFKLTYKNNKNAGKATVVVEGTGNYTGSKAAVFVIDKADISKASAATGIAGAYSGTAKMPSITVKMLGTTLHAGSDYSVTYKNNVNAGDATAVISGMGNFKGSRLVNFAIAKADISNASASLASAGSYTGAAKTPAATVRFGSTTLRSGKDFVLTYKNNKNAGTGVAVFAGRGNFQGSKSVSFSIGKADLSHASVSVASAGAYTGKAKTPAVKVTSSGRALSKGSDFNLSFRSNKDAGKATVTVEGTGNYKGSKSVSFSIAKAENPLALKTADRVLNASVLANRAQTVTAVAFAKKPEGKVTFKNASASAVSNVVSVDKSTGALTVKKGAKKGTYVVKVVASAAGNANYKSASKMATVKVTVR